MRNGLTQIITAAALVLAFSAVCGAQPAFRDGNNESSIFFNEGGGFAQISVSDKSIRLGYLRDNGNQKPYYGFDVTGKATGNFASLFTGDAPSPEANFSFFVGKRFIGLDSPEDIRRKCVRDMMSKDPTLTEQAASLECLRNAGPIIRRQTINWLTFRASYRRGRYKILDETAAFANQIRKQNFDGYAAVVAYNTQLTLDKLPKRNGVAGQAEQADARAGAETAEVNGTSRGSLIFGVSFGVERRNNASDLDETEIEDQGFTSSSGTTQRRAVSRQNVLTGTYSEFTAVPLNTDVWLHPTRINSRLAIDFYTRSNLGQGGREFVPGVGVFITEKGKPTRIVGGLTFSVKDGSGRVGLVGGLNF